MRASGHQKLVAAESSMTLLSPLLQIVVSIKAFHHSIPCLLFAYSGLAAVRFAPGHLLCGMDSIRPV